jgi:glutathione S-transferase
VLSRSVRLSQAALDVGDAAQSEALLRLAEEHQAGLAAHLEEAGFQTILRQFQEFLDFFEKELESERFGSWLGGASFSTADIALGTYCNIRIYGPAVTAMLCFVSVLLDEQLILLSAGTSV